MKQRRLAPILYKAMRFLFLPRGQLCCNSYSFFIRVLTICFLLFFPFCSFTSVASSFFYISLHSIFDVHFHENSIFMRMPRLYLYVFYDNCSEIAAKVHKKKHNQIRCAHCHGNPWQGIAASHVWPIQAVI